MNNKTKKANNLYDDGNIPDIDMPLFKNNSKEKNAVKSRNNDGIVEPLPESTRERKDGPGGD